MTTTATNQTQRLQYFDILKGLAIIMVVLIHSTNYYAISPNIHPYGMIIWRNFLCFAVPLFITLSGYFMATKQLEAKSAYLAFLRKQIPRVLIPYILWGIIYSSISLMSGTSITTVVGKFILFQASVPLYFIGVIIQLYLLAPFTQRIATRKGLFATGLLSIVYCLIIYFLKYKYGIKLPVFIYAGTFVPWLFFNVLGVYFGREKTIVGKRKYLILFSVSSFILLCLDSNYEFMNFNDYKAATSTIRVTSLIFCFFIISLLFSFKSSNLKSIFLKYIGEISFGIYFSHMLFLIIFAKNLEGVLNRYNDFVYQIGLPILILLCATVLCYLARFINKSFSVKYLGL